jgi:glycosyltransferase involved in cell wall biosynthesis
MQYPKQLLAALARPMLRLEGKPIQLKLKHVICVSATLRDNLTRAGVPLQEVRIIHPGIDIAQFADAGRAMSPRSDGLALVYAGQLAAHKGVHTAVEALARLNQVRAHVDVTLTLVGAGHPDYVAGLKGLVAQKKVTDRVQFLGRVRRADMPALLRRFDALVFPSVCEEGFGRVLVEAMAAGLPIIGTRVGGSKEILVDGENALVFDAGDAEGLATQIERLATNPELRSYLADNARQTVIERFNIERTISEIEAYLTMVRANSL